MDKNLNSERTGASANRSSGGSTRGKSVWNEWKELDRKALPGRPIGTVQELYGPFRRKIEALMGISESESALHAIQGNWNQLVGLLAAHSEPVSIKERVLIVEVRESVYSQELQLHSRNILRNIEKTLGTGLVRIQIKRAGFRK